jgi:hypothetical protein
MGRDSRPPAHQRRRFLRGRGAWVSDAGFTVVLAAAGRTGEAGSTAASVASVTAPGEGSSALLVLADDRAAVAGAGARRLDLD